MMLTHVPRVLQVAVVALTVSCWSSQVREVRAVRADRAHGNMIVLTERNFHSETAGPRPALVYFYTKWCSHCRDSAPAFDELAAAVRHQPGLGDVTVANMDAERHADFLADQGQTLYGYPTIRLYFNGKHADFEAERFVPKMLHWVERRVTGVKMIATREEVANFIELDSAAVVGFIKDPKSAAAELLQSVARAMENLPFAMVCSQELMEEFDAEDGLVSIFTKFDGGRVDFDLAPTEEALRLAIQRAATPLVVDFQDENARSVLSGALGAQAPDRSVLVVYLSQRDGHYDQYLDVLRSIAMEHRNYTFLTVDADNARSDPMFDLLGVERSSVPCMRLWSGSGNGSERDKYVKYVPESNRLSPKDIRAFLNGVNVGVIKVGGESETGVCRDRECTVLADACHRCYLPANNRSVNKNSC